MPAQTAEHAGHDHSLAGAPASSTTVGSEAIADAKPATSDTAQLLSGTPGVSILTNGGVSSLPVIHGMADDRVRTEVDGMLISAACPNHMNPVLSYIDPAAVSQAKVYAGITPVSAGGDSIGGMILVEGAGPRFAAGRWRDHLRHGLRLWAQQWRRHRHGRLGVGGDEQYQHYLHRRLGQIQRLQGRQWRQGAVDLLRNRNHKLALAIREGTSLFVIEGGIQHIPYEGFPTQPMDLTGNDAWFVNARYTTRLDWGKLDLRAYYQDTTHEMNFLDDKQNAAGTRSMPMDTHSQNFGYSIKSRDTGIPAGYAARRQRIARPNARRLVAPGPNTSGPGGTPKPGRMCCDTFWNINNGQRYDVGTYIEWERKWDPKWSSLLGVRNDIVWMDTGNVQGYNSTTAYYAGDANYFNSLSHKHTDVNFDATALAKYEPSLWSAYEGGYSMKTRSPSLYERYAWSTGSMGASMNGWFGDANSYVGNNDLKPETAHTFSFSAGWHDAGSYKDSGSRDWEVKITPYYTYVENYIDADRCGPTNTHIMMMTGCTAANLTAKSGGVTLIFANHDAEMYGVDVSGRKLLADSGEFGRFVLAGRLGYVQSRNLDTGDNLYGIMPVNAKLSLEQKLGNWSNAAELQIVASHSNVSSIRDELQTPGYGLVNLRSSYQWGQVRFDLGVENLFNQQYYSPVGSRYFEYSGTGWVTNANGHPALPIRAATSTRA